MWQLELADDLPAGRSSLATHRAARCPRARESDGFDLSAASRGAAPKTSSNVFIELPSNAFRAALTILGLRLRQQLRHHPRRLYAGQSLVEALELECKACVIEA
jgi:hypothetical protein